MPSGYAAEAKTGTLKQSSGIALLNCFAPPAPTISSKIGTRPSSLRSCESGTWVPILLFLLSAGCAGDSTTSAESGSRDLFEDAQTSNEADAKKAEQADNGAVNKDIWDESDAAEIAEKKDATHAIEVGGSDAQDALETDPRTQTYTGEEIEAEPGSWTWVEFPETRCADGSSTGLGVNLQPGAEMALIYLEGGGACWNYSNCFGLVQTSLHLGGFDEGDFNGPLVKVYIDGPLFERDNAKNPFADAHHIFIPYCTGDAFAGNQKTTLEGFFPWESEEIYFYGHSNIKEYLKRLVPTLEGVSKVVISGSSAGGFGAGISWPTFVQAFPGIPVDLLDDSGPPISPIDGRWEEWTEAWNVAFPEDCPDCGAGIENMVEYIRATILPENKMGLISYESDAIISTFMSIFPSTFRERLHGLCDILDEEENGQYFILPGALHTMLIAGFESAETSEGMPLWRWVEKMVKDEPDWSSYRP